MQSPLVVRDCRAGYGTLYPRLVPGLTSLPFVATHNCSLKGGRCNGSHEVLVRRATAVRQMVADNEVLIGRMDASAAGIPLTKARLGHGRSGSSTPTLSVYGRSS